MKTIQNFVDHFRRAFGGRDICLNIMVVRPFRGGGARGDDDGCSALLETVCNRLARPFCAARYKNAPAIKFNCWLSIQISLLLFV